jgi:purine-nucleoside phosphorylase
VSTSASEASAFDLAREAADAVRRECDLAPRAAIVLGSGLGGLADEVADRVVVPYERIPHFPRPTVAGHSGNLILGRLAGVPVAVFQGRFHYYEGHDLEVVTRPVRLAKALGAGTLILSAAVGGIAEGLRPGDLVCLSDHLNLIGANPLRGPNDDRLGPRFFDMGSVYTPRLRERARRVASELGLDLKSGVYACFPGPSYETPAEIRMLRALGADVVGMSTVPEAIAARHAGLDVLAFAVVTNLAAGLSAGEINHEEVQELGKAAGPKLGAILREVVKGLD